MRSLSGVTFWIRWLKHRDVNWLVGKVRRHSGKYWNEMGLLENVLFNWKFSEMWIMLEEYFLAHCWVGLQAKKRRCNLWPTIFKVSDSMANLCSNVTIFRLWKRYCIWQSTAEDVTKKRKKHADVIETTLHNIWIAHYLSEKFNDYEIYTFYLNFFIYCSN